VTRFRILLLSVLVVVLLGVAFAGYRTYHYVEHDPNFCASCHLMQTAWNTWKQGPHNKFTCHVCHQQYIQDRVRIVWHWAISDIKSVPPHTQLNRRVCESCHLNDKTNWPQISKTAGHEVHVKKTNLECLSCHLPSLHAVKPTTEACVTCHSKARTNAGGMVAFHCTTCHQFTVKGADLEPKRSVCLGCHAGMKLKGETFPEEAAPMQFECAACHKPHSQPVLRFNDCLGCHPKVTEDKIHAERKTLTRCITCHRPHSWKAQAKTLVKAN